MTTAAAGVKQRPASDAERYDHGFAVFNGHVNDASARASYEFIAQFGQERYDKHIGRFDDGIMAIFDTDPNKWQLIWVALVTAFVNEVQA